MVLKLVVILSSYVFSFPILNKFPINELPLQFGETQKPMKGRQVVWVPKSNDGNIIFATILLNASQKNSNIQLILEEEIPSMNIVSASCEGNIIRPRENFSPLIAKSNIISCAILFENDVEGKIVWDLSNEPIYRWGNKFYPKGFSIKNELARTLFRAFKETYNVLSSNDYFNYRNVNLETPTIIYEFEDYQIYYDPYIDYYYGKMGTTVLTCTKEFLYAPNEEKPLNPTEERCDFIYLWTYIPNSE